MKRTLLGGVGLSLLGRHSESDPAIRRILPTSPAGTIPAAAIAALRAANVSPNADGSYNAVTGSGSVVRVTADSA